MEQFPNNMNNESSRAGEEGMLSEKAIEMIVESLKNTLKKHQAKLDLKNESVVNAILNNGTPQRKKLQLC